MSIDLTPENLLAYTQTPYPHTSESQDFQRGYFSAVRELLAHFNIDENQSEEHTDE